MVTQPAYLRALKAYTRVRYGTDEDVSAAVADLSDESDRGALMLAATGTEDMLEYEILKHMPTLLVDEAARKQMFEQDGPIATFSRKIGMAYALGILDKEFRAKTDLIREIRNACAHSRKRISLKVPEVMNVCQALIGEDELKDFKDREPATIRSAFVVECGFVSHYIASREKIKGADARLRYYAELRRESA